MGQMVRGTVQPGQPTSDSRVFENRAEDLEKRTVPPGVRFQKTYPDNTSSSARRTNARGEIPVYLLNTTALKDGVQADLTRDQGGPGGWWMVAEPD